MEPHSPLTAAWHDRPPGGVNMELFKQKRHEDPQAQQRLQRETQTVRDILFHYAPGTRLHFGAPSRCPKCGDYGFVQNVNHGEGVSHNHCFSCREDWIITIRALRIVDAEPTPFPEFHPTPRTPISPSQPAAAPSPPPAPPPAPPVATAAAEPASAHPTTALPVRTPTAVQPQQQRPAAAAVAPSASTPAPLRLVESPAATTRPLTTKIRVIVAESNPFDLGVVEELAEMATSVQLELIPAATRAAAERIASTTDHDIVLMNLELHDSSGFATILEWQHSGSSSAPVIVINSNSDVAASDEARALGVAHIIQKGQLDELVALGSVGSDRFARLLRTTLERSASPSRPALG